jgi:hypothetical protein
VKIAMKKIPEKRFSFENFTWAFPEEAGKQAGTLPIGPEAKA